MRTAISDEELSDGSGAERTASATKPKRQRNSAKYNDPDEDYVKDEDEDVVKTVEDAGTNGDNGDDDDEEDEGEEDEGDV